MNRPWKIWLVFGCALAVVLAAMGWVSLTALRLDRAQVQASSRPSSRSASAWRCGAWIRCWRR